MNELRLGIETIFRRRRLWSIFAILSLSASVNLLTGLPGTGWSSKSCWLKTAAITGIVTTLLAGVGFQLLFEDISSYFVAGRGVLSEAITTVKGTPDEKTIVSRCIWSITLAVLAATSWIVYAT